MYFDAFSWINGNCSFHSVIVNSETFNGVLLIIYKTNKLELLRKLANNNSGLGHTNQKYLLSLHFLYQLQKSFLDEIPQSPVAPEVTVLSRFHWTTARIQSLISRSQRCRTSFLCEELMKILYAQFDGLIN